MHPFQTLWHLWIPKPVGMFLRSTVDLVLLVLLSNRSSNPSWIVLYESPIIFLSGHSMNYLRSWRSLLPFLLPIEIEFFALISTSDVRHSSCFCRSLWHYFHLRARYKWVWQKMGCRTGLDQPWLMDSWNFFWSLRSSFSFLLGIEIEVFALISTSDVRHSSFFCRSLWRYFHLEARHKWAPQKMGWGLGVDRLWLMDSMNYLRSSLSLLAFLLGIVIEVFALN